MFIEVSLRGRGRMATREENRAVMQQRIFDAALDLFCEMGYLKTTLADIAVEADVSTRTLYKYFPTKESILRKFGEDNIKALRVYAEGLPDDLSCRERVVSVMTQDYTMMFCLFDVAYVLHPARDDSGVFNKFEIRNILSTEAIYRDILREEQRRQGIEPNAMATLGASVLMGIYRQCTDLYRFLRRGATDPEEVEAYYSSHLDMVWDTLMQSLVSPPSKNQRRLLSDGRLFGSEDR